MRSNENKLIIKSWGDKTDQAYEYLSISIYKITELIESKIISIFDIEETILNRDVEIHYNQKDCNMIIEVKGEEELILNKRTSISTFLELLIEIEKEKD